MSHLYFQAFINLHKIYILKCNTVIYSVFKIHSLLGGLLTSPHDKDNICIAVHRYHIYLLGLHCIDLLSRQNNCISANTHHYRTLLLHASQVVGLLA